MIFITPIQISVTCRDLEKQRLPPRNPELPDRRDLRHALRISAVRRR